jgi:hypothetical protein
MLRLICFLFLTAIVLVLLLLTLLGHSLMLCFIICEEAFVISFQFVLLPNSEYFLFLHFLGSYVLNLCKFLVFTNLGFTNFGFYKFYSVSTFLFYIQHNLQFRNLLFTIYKFYSLSIYLYYIQRNLQFRNLLFTIYKFYSLSIYFYYIQHNLQFRNLLFTIYKFYSLSIYFCYIQHNYHLSCSVLSIWWEREGRQTDIRIL